MLSSFVLTAAYIKAISFIVNLLFHLILNSFSPAYIGKLKLIFYHSFVDTLKDKL
ncbi:hypothetical protein COPG_00009 [Colwellia phage 9A]|uniref:Uncharacterized protein n=1 Tax=Colwellia phage 9A TaxID=765765 RepID=I3UM90_9CAUD|nr:hypothetical protein COPG_00009 [Colwellia phage 9A]AFK66605.1 hypothetical protein COPG_00009 [Colwellia phage 9A]